MTDRDRSKTEEGRERKRAKDTEREYLRKKRAREEKGGREKEKRRESNEWKPFQFH